MGKVQVGPIMEGSLCMQGLRPAALRIYEKKMQLENVKMGKSTQTATHTLAAIGYLLNAAEITIDCTVGWEEKSQWTLLKLWEKKESKKENGESLKKPKANAKLNGIQTGQSTESPVAGNTKDTQKGCLMVCHGIWQEWKMWEGEMWNCVCGAAASASAWALPRHSEQDAKVQSINGSNECESATQLHEEQKQEQELEQQVVIPPNWYARVGVSCPAAYAFLSNLIKLQLNNLFLLHLSRRSASRRSEIWN